MKDVSMGQNAVMIDLETAGTQPNAAIFSIAIQQFNINTGELGGNIHVFPPLGEQITISRTIDPDTMVWWAKQSLLAQHALISNRALAEERGYTLEQAWNDVDSMVRNADALWANDPDFDCVILKDFMGPKYPWPFWKHRSVRTMRMLDQGREFRHEPTLAHDALSDCHAQIKDVCAIYKALSIDSITELLD